MGMTQYLFPSVSWGWLTSLLCTLVKELAKLAYGTYMNDTMTSGHPRRRPHTQLD